MAFDNIKAFANYLKLQRGLSPATIKAYRYELAHYCRWLETTGKTLAELGPKDIDGYVRYMVGELELQSKTCKRRIAAVSTYHKWMVREGIMQNDPVHFIMFPKAASRLPVYLNEEEIGLFVGMVEDEAAKRPVIGARNRALMYLMIFGGLRISETLTIRETNVTLRDGCPVMVTVIGKGNKERQVPLADDVARAWSLGVWVVVRRAQSR